MLHASGSIVGLQLYYNIGGLPISVPDNYFNPLKGSGIGRLHFKVFSAYFYWLHPCLFWLLLTTCATAQLSVHLQWPHRLLLSG